MAGSKSSDLNGELVTARNKTSAPRRKAEYHSQRRVEAVSMRLAGLSFTQIAERMNITEGSARTMVKRSLSKAENRNADEMRELENARLDRAQAAIWPQVLKGDTKAINTYLQISTARRQMNGLNAASKVDISLSVQQEMDQALNELEEMLVEAEQVNGEDTPRQIESSDTPAIEEAYEDAEEVTDE